MNDRCKYRIPMFTDKGHFIEYQYVSLGDTIEVMLCGYNGEPEQCTGLRDRNGKLIYEGDVLKFESQVEARVTFGNGCFWYSPTKSKILRRWLSELSAKETEIIGNIHEQEVSE